MKNDPLLSEVELGVNTELSPEPQTWTRSWANPNSRDATGFLGVSGEEGKQGREGGGPDCWVPGALLGHCSVLPSPSDELRTSAFREKGRPDDVSPPSPRAVLTLIPGTCGCVT